MRKLILSALLVIITWGAYAQTKSNPYTMIKTKKTEVTASMLKQPYYIENVHPNERLFKKGKNAAKREEYYSNGTLKEIWYSYRINGNMFTYCIKKYYANGQLKYDHYQNPFTDYKEGYQNEFYENGQLKQTDWITGFYYNGDRYSFYENGQLKSYGYYAGFEGNGLEDGMWKYYHDNGQLKAIGAYKNHVLEQKTKHDRLRAPQSTKTGEWKYYNEYGELTKTENF